MMEEVTLLHAENDMPDTLMIPVGQQLNTLQIAYVERLLGRESTFRVPVALTSIRLQPANI